MVCLYWITVSSVGFKILLSQLQFVEDKYSTLIVKAKHNKDVASLFELYNSGTSGLSERHRQNLALAVRTAPTAQSQGYSRDNQQSRQRSGRFFSHNFGRGSDQSRRPDTYNHMLGRGLPTSRPQQNNPSSSSSDAP